MKTSSSIEEIFISFLSSVLFEIQSIVLFLFLLIIRTKESAPSVDESKKRKLPIGGEEDFPRGGASALTPLEYKEIKHQVDAELFKVRYFGCERKIAKRKKGKGGEESN